jgi:ATP-dependent Clp protease protease subunit
MLFARKHDRHAAAAEEGDRPGLDESGILFLTGEVCAASAGALVERMIELNLRRETDYLQLIINSPGGDWHAGFAVVDIMEWSQLPVYTTGLGLVASMGLVILMAGHKGQRVVTANTSLLSHCFSATSSGTRPELVARRRQEDWMHERLVAHYARHSALKTEPEITGRLLQEVDTWLTPQEAVALGLVDRVHPATPS